METDVDVTAYRRDGFLIVSSMFTEAEAADMKETVYESTADKENPIGVEVWMPDRVPESILEILLGPPLSNVLHKLIGPNVDFLSVKSVSKSDTVREASPWHQDRPYWLGSEKVSVWMALDRATIDNGCLHFVPQSHKYGKLEPIRLGVEGESIADKMRALGHDVAEPVAMDMEAGGVTFHHGCNFHFAGPNRTDQPRRAFAVIFIPDFVTFTGGHEAAGAGEEMTAGAPWDHPLHPILAGKA